MTDWFEFISQRVAADRLENTVLNSPHSPSLFVEIKLFFAFFVLLLFTFSLSNQDNRG